MSLTDTPYRSAGEMRRATTATDPLAVPHGTALTATQARALLDAAHARARRNLLGRIAAADPETRVTIELVRRGWHSPALREFRTTAAHAPGLIHRMLRRADAVSLRVRIGDGLWHDLSASLVNPAV